MMPSKAKPGSPLSLPWPRVARQVNAWDLAGSILLIALVLLVVYTFRDYAVSNDEGVQHHYGTLIISYYRSWFADRSVFHFDNLYLYGGVFDIIAVTLSNLLPLNPYHIRHILCALIGVSGIGATWATARLIAGPRAGVLSAATLASCGAWYGCMFNHTKDIPLAAAMMGSFYFLVLAARRLPRPHCRDVLLFGVLAGIALGIKVLGLLLLVYLVVAIVLKLLEQASDGNSPGVLFLVSARAFVPALILIYLIMIAAWPWAALNPLNPVQALISFSDFHYHIHTMLAGQQYEMATSPRWYVPIYLGIKVPLLTLFGAALALCAVLRLRLRHGCSANDQSREIILVAFTVFFPLACQVIGHGPAFTGMRHFLFVLPPLAVLAGIGFDFALTTLSSRYRQFAAGAAAFIGMIIVWNAVTLVRLHPYEYLYYNSFVGGLEGASRRYVMDYWVNIMPEAVKQLASYVGSLKAQQGNSAPIVYRIAVCGERVSFANEAGANPQLEWTPDWPRADFFIAPTHMNCDRALDGAVIATVQRLGVTIGVVKDRRAITRPPLMNPPIPVISDVRGSPGAAVRSQRSD